MKELEKLIKAIACIKEAQNYVNDFKGKDDHLVNVKEPLEEAIVFISDTIALNAER